MGEFNRCFDAFKNTVYKSTAKYEGIRVLNENKLQDMEKYCQAIDGLMEFNEARTLTIKVYDITGEIALCVATPAFEMSANIQQNLDLIRNATSVSFHKVPKIDVSVEFMFPGVWDEIDTIW